MPRIRINLPPNKHSTHQIPVRITDLNYGRHLGNDSFVTIMHEARMQWLVKAGYSEFDIGGISLIMADLGIEYKAEVEYGNTLWVTLYVGEVSRLSFELFYEIRNERSTLVALAKTGMVCFDYKVKKVGIMPEAFSKFLNEGQ